MSDATKGLMALLTIGLLTLGLGTLAGLAVGRRPRVDFEEDPRPASAPCPADGCKCRPFLRPTGAVGAVK